MTRTYSIATNTAYTDILAQNHESYLQLRRQQRTILGSARKPRVRRRDSSMPAPSFSKRFKTKYLPVNRRLLFHPQAHPAVHKAFSAPLYHSRLNGRPRRPNPEPKYTFRYKTLRSRKSPAELLPRPLPRTSTPAQRSSSAAVKSSSSTLPNSSSESSRLAASEVSVAAPVSPVESVALCISNLPPNSQTGSQRVTLFGMSVKSQDNTTGRILSYAEYWLESSKAELKKLKEPLKKQTAALENVAHRMVSPTSSRFRKVRGYMHREKPHAAVAHETAVHNPADAVAGLATETVVNTEVPHAKLLVSPQAPPATGASSAQLCMLQNTRNMMALQKMSKPHSECTSGHGDTDCGVCNFVEQVNMRLQQFQHAPSVTGTPEDSMSVTSAPGRMLLPVPSVPTRDAGVVLIQQVLDYLKNAGFSSPDCKCGSAAVHAHHSGSSSAVSTKRSQSPDALMSLVYTLIETLQGLPDPRRGIPGKNARGTAKGNCRGSSNAKSSALVPSTKNLASGQSDSSGSDNGPETNPEANFNNQVVPSIFGRNYLVLSPISSFDGSVNNTPEPEYDCGFLTGPSRLLKQVRFIVDDEFNAQDTSVTWWPHAESDPLGSFRESGLQGYLMELGGSEETLVLQSAGLHDETMADNFNEFSYQMASSNFAFASDDSLDSGYVTARSSS